MGKHQSTIEEIAAQALKEIAFAEQYKRKRVGEWNVIEDMYYARKVKQKDTRADVELAKAQGFVNTLLSKIDNPLTFKYMPGEMGDRKKAQLMNAVKDKDAKVGRWNFKDLLGKRQAIIYGRAIYLYYAEQKDGEYRSCMELIDPKDFLIDPAAGGLDIEKALYLGWWNTRISRVDLEKGMKDGTYIAKAAKELLDGNGNATEQPQVEIDKQNRFAAFSTVGNRDMERDDLFKCYSWFTTFQKDGKRYYLVLTKSGQVVRCEEWKKVQRSNLYPVWSWATNPDPHEFWTLGSLDYMKDNFLGQRKSINQMLDNAEAINQPLIAVNRELVKNFEQVKSRRTKIIELFGKEKLSDVVQTFQTPSIDTPIKTYQTLDLIAQSESGVTGATRGLSEEDKVGIYEGNIQQAADRFGLLNKCYADGYDRLGTLHKEGVMQHLTKKMAIQIIGPDGMRIKYVTNRNLKPSRADYDIVVESSQAEAQSSALDQKNKLGFLARYDNRPDIANQKVVAELSASIAGFDDETIKRLLDTSDYGTTEMIAQAEEDYQQLILGKEVKPFAGANTAYVQRLIELRQENDDETDMEQEMIVDAYMQEVMPIVEQNMARSLADKVSKVGMMGALGGQPGQPPVQGEAPPLDEMPQETPTSLPPSA